MKKIKNFIKKIDFFSEPITLFLYEEKRFRTLSGGLFSIIMVLSLFLFSINELMSVLDRTNITMQMSEEIHVQPQKISLNNSFAVHLDPKILNSLDKKRYFDIQFIFGVHHVDENGTLIENSKRFYNVTKCNSNHFPMFTKQQQIDYNITEWICPDFQNSSLLFDIEGTFDNGIYKFINIRLSECTSKGVDDVCANESEIENIRKENSGKFYMDIKLVNNVIDGTKYEEPFLPFIENIQQVLSFKNSYVQKELYLTAVNLLTDDTQSFRFMRGQNKFNLKQSYVFDRKTDAFFVNENTYSKGKQTFFSVFLRSGIISKNYKRSYYCFEDYLKVIGSLNNIFYFLFYLLNKFFSSDKLILKIGKSLYEDKNIQKSKEENNKISKNGLEFLKNLICYFQKILSFFKKCKKKRERFSLEMKKKAAIKDLDILQILKKIKEMEVLKKIFLNDDQRILLNYTCKPKIQEEIKLKSIADFKFHEKINEKKIIPIKNPNSIHKEILFDQVEKAYNNILNSKNELDRKIICLVDDKIINRTRFGLEVSLCEPSRRNKTSFFKEKKQIQ